MPVLYPAVLNGTVPPDESNIDALLNEFMLVQEDKINTAEFVEIQVELLATISLGNEVFLLAGEDGLDEGTVYSVSGGFGTNLSDVVISSEAVSKLNETLSAIPEVLQSKTFGKKLRQTTSDVRLRIRDTWVRYSHDKRLPVLVDDDNIHLTSVQDIKTGDNIVEYKGDLSVFDKHTVVEVAQAPIDVYVVPFLLNYSISDSELENWTKANTVKLVPLSETIVAFKTNALQLDRTKPLHEYLSIICELLSEGTDQA